MKDNINENSNFFNPYVEADNNNDNEDLSFNASVKFNETYQKTDNKEKEWNDGYLQSDSSENSNNMDKVSRKKVKEIAKENTADLHWKDNYSQNEEQKTFPVNAAPKKTEIFNNPYIKNPYPQNSHSQKENFINEDYNKQQPIENRNNTPQTDFNVQSINNTPNKFKNQQSIKSNPMCGNYFVNKQNNEIPVKSSQPNINTNANANVTNNYNGDYQHNSRRYNNPENTFNNPNIQTTNNLKSNYQENTTRTNVQNLNNGSNRHQDNTTRPNTPPPPPQYNYNPHNNIPYGYNQNTPSNPNCTFNYNNQQYTNSHNMGNQPDMRSVNRNYDIPRFKSLKKVYDKVDRLFAIFSIVLGFLFIFLIGSVFFNFGIGATIFFIATLLTSYFYLYKKNIKIDTLHNVAFVFMILLSFPFTIYSNRLALGIDFTVLIFSLLYWIYSAGGKTRKHLGETFTELIISWFAYPFMNFVAVFSALFKKDKSQKQGNARWIILGLIIALPIVCIVSYLLLMGDEMFNAMFSVIFENFISKIFEYLWYAVLGLPIAMGIFSAWYTKYYEDKKRTLSINSNTKKNSNYINCHIAPIPLMYSIAIPLCVVYFLYLISQIAYLISFIADNLLPAGFTIVDYARSGFFELCVVTVINIVVIALLLIFTKRPSNVIPMGLRIITTLMSVFTIVIIGTALYKMFMYINEYGYTSMRINTSIFMIFLLIVFVLIIAKQFFVNVKFFTTTVVIAFAFLAGYNLMDVDAFIARENIRMFQQGQIPWMGNSMIATLDDSAFEYIVPFAADKNNGLSENENLDTYIRARYRRFNDDKFSTFNVSSYKVHNIMKEYGYDTTKTYDYGDTYNDYDYSYDYDDTYY